MSNSAEPKGVLSTKYWMSLEQWSQDEEFRALAETEFRSNPLSSEDGKDGWARREFLKLMGASLALTSFGCIRRPAQTIVPYVKRPMDVTPGLANYYASSMVDGTEGFGLLVTTREGRPIKLEGNPSHPVNEGAMSARATASILSLYDPDRLNGPRKNLLNEKKSNRDTVSITYEAADKEIAAQLKKGGVAILTGPLASPSTRTLVSNFAQAFSAQHFQWSPFCEETLREGQRRSYGKAVIPRFRFDRARYIVSLGADFLGTFLSPTEFNRQFSKGRRPGGEMNRLVVFEGNYSLTGGNADQRFRVRPSQLVTVVMGLLHEIVVRMGQGRSDGELKSTLANYADTAVSLKLDAAQFRKVAEELWENRGKSLVIAGGQEGATETGLALHVAVNLLNSVLGNDGVTVDGTEVMAMATGSSKEMADLIEGLMSKSIRTLIIHGVNPRYAMPQNSNFAGAMAQAEMVIYTGDRNDETGLFSDYVLPDHHALENWGDAEFYTGIYSVQQPTISPLGETRAFQDALLSWAKVAQVGGSSLQAASWYEYLRHQWKTRHANNRSLGIAKADFEAFWISLLQEGVFDTTADRRARAASARSFDSSSLQVLKSLPAKTNGLELVLHSTKGLADGTLANVSWLQEFPDPVAKICWDNYLSVSPALAEREGLRQGQMVVVTVSGVERKVPTHIQPGQHDDVVGLAVGYGRTAAGKVGNGVGVEAFSLARFGAQGTLYSGLSTTLKKTKEKVELASTQGHHSMEGRQIVVEATLADFKKDPESNIHRHKMFSMWEPHKYTGNKWGMTIDLNLCTGCSACVIACQSENNIPTVGKKYTILGREMHWIRIDRYYVGEPAEPDSVYQPLTCMHCDNAPCETVCPVAATVHSDEGTNDMIYNRCVGTRYCSNNCPYKVRRFNWFDYTHKQVKPLTMALNPEVTVRDRGVMEKCTFCIHRIRGVKSQVKLEKRAIRDGEIKTACQQACPTHAIVFGDLNDANSQVRKVWEEKRQYALLEELNNQPAVRYLTKIRNVDQLKGGHGHHGQEHGHGDNHSDSHGEKGHGEGHNS